MGFRESQDKKGNHRGLPLPTAGRGACSAHKCPLFYLPLKVMAYLPLAVPAA